MHRVDTPTAIAAPPAQNAVGTPGYFSQGSSTGTPPATVPGQDFFNSVQEELVGAVVGAGLALSKSNNGQLLQAIIALAKAYGFSTGDAKLTFKNVADAGWVLSNEGSIGNFLSNATTRANNDTEALFTLLWNNITDAWCPVQNSSGDKVARGANAAADFAADRRLRLSRTLGRAIAVAGLGKWAEIFTVNTVTNLLTVPVNDSIYTGAIVYVSNVGGAPPAPLVVGTNYYAIRLNNFEVWLATSLANAHVNMAIDITTAGTGVNTLNMSLANRVLGEHLGEEKHSMMTDENAAHSHNKSAYNTGGSGTTSIIMADATSHTMVTDQSGTGAPHNILGPETFMNIMIKL